MKLFNLTVYTCVDPVGRPLSVTVCASAHTREAVHDLRDNLRLRLKSCPAVQHGYTFVDRAPVTTTIFGNHRLRFRLAFATVIPERYYETVLTHVYESVLTRLALERPRGIKLHEYKIKPGEVSL